MSRFSETLHSINERLELPQPARSRVLLEIANDLQDLEGHFLEQGLDEDEAKRKALELCDLSDEAISNLVRVHTGLYRRFLERFNSQVKNVWERCLLVGVLLVITLLLGRHVLSNRFFEEINPVAWPILVITLSVLVMLLPKYYVIYLKMNHNLKRLRKGLGLAPGLAACNVLMGIYGFWLGLYPIALRASMGDDEAIPFIIDWLMSGSAMLIVCFLTSILIIVLWFILASKIAELEMAEASLLLDE